MDITTGRKNLLRLWLESFVVVNQCTGKLIRVGLCILFVLALIIGVLILGVGIGPVLENLQMAASSQITDVRTGIVSMASSLLGNLLSLFFMTVMFRIIAAHVLQVKQPLTEAFSSSVWPTIYQIVASLLLVILVFIVGIVAALIGALFPPLGLIVMIGVLFLAVRFVYSFIAIAVDNKGPIEGLLHSWKLTSGTDYIDALVMCLMIFFSTLLLYAALAGIGYLLYICIPLYFPNSFNLAHPSLIWWLLGLLLVILSIFYYFVMLTFPVLVFLNRNIQETPIRKDSAEEIFIPLPELETPDTQTSAPAQPDVKTTEPAPTPATQVTAPPEGMEMLEITKTSVNTKETEDSDLSQHLQQVYTPREKEMVQHQEEDRMPTILFDDELAKQLEHQFLEDQQSGAKKDESSGDDSIQLSK